MKLFEESSLINNLVKTDNKEVRMENSKIDFSYKKKEKFLYYIALICETKLQISIKNDFLSFQYLLKKLNCE